MRLIDLPYHFCRPIFKHAARRQVSTVARRLSGAACGIGCVVLLGACSSIVPGMRMPGSPDVAASSEPSGAVTTLPVPIVDINLDLIRKLDEDNRKSSADKIRALAGTPQAYLLGVGDVLQITVWDHPELAAAVGAQVPANTRASDPIQGFVIDSSGNVEFPYAGKIHAAGLTVDQLEERLVTGLSRPGGFTHPAVTVRVASFRAKDVYVEGEVHTPGAVPINDVPMTLDEAISRAGGFTGNADESQLALVRDGVAYPLNHSKISTSPNGPANIILHDGDVLRVSARSDSGAYVMGEVNHPLRAQPLMSGELTLSDALNQAGSINTASADAAQIYVVRRLAGNTTGATPAEVFHLNAQSPVAMVLANEFELQPNDIVYVDSNSLVRFNRVLSLLLPAIDSGLTAAIITR